MQFKIIKNLGENFKGILYGGILSFLLINWVLDGLSMQVRLSSIISNVKFIKNNIVLYDSKLRFVCRKKSLNKSLLYATTYCVRFLDTFLVMICQEGSLLPIITGIQKFLQVRGISINERNSQIIKWTLGKKLDFLGWTYHLVWSKKNRWVLNNEQVPFFIGKGDKVIIYIYLSKKTIQFFRSRIKEILSFRNISKAPNLILSSLNLFILRWSTYFLSGLSQYHLRCVLDYYVFKRSMKWLYKKYMVVGLRKVYRKGFLRIVRLCDLRSPVSLKFFKFF